jgi:subtilisin family serine protease
LDDDGNGSVDDVWGWNFLQPGALPAPGADLHGTCVAGVLCGLPDASVGLTGVVPSLTIIPLKVTDGENTPDYRYAWAKMVSEAFDYAVTEHVKIINLSIGLDTLLYIGQGATLDDYPELKASIERAYAAGILMIFAAGNNDGVLQDNRLFEQMLIVGATDENDLHAKFYPQPGGSDCGVAVDICAPGTDILITAADRYGAASGGTSFSAPMVAGAAALVWAQHPDWIRDQVVAQLLGTADLIDPIPGNANYAGLMGSGLLDIRPASKTWNSSGTRCTGKLWV